jgi:hypothetical protein
MRLLLAIPLFLVPMVADFALIHRLAKDRTDLGPCQSPYEGASIFWQVNSSEARELQRAGLIFVA